MIKGELIVAVTEVTVVFFSLQLGLVDLEINTLTKLLFLAVMILSLLMMILKVGCILFSE